MKKHVACLILSFLLITPFVAMAQTTDQTDPAPAQAMSQKAPSEEAMKKRIGGFTLSPGNPSTIDPNKIIVEIKPGAIYEDSVVIVNKSDNEVNLHLFAVDGTPGENGATNAKDEQDQQNDIGQWVTIENSEVTLAPKENKEIKFFVYVPAGTEERLITGFICALLPQAPNTEDNGMINLSLRYALKIDLTVTNNPKYIAKIGETNIFAAATPYFWGSLAFFLVSLTYFIYGFSKERKKKKQPTR